MNRLEAFFREVSSMRLTFAGLVLALGELLNATSQNITAPVRDMPK